MFVGIALGLWGAGSVTAQDDGGAPATSQPEPRPAADGDTADKNAEAEKYEPAEEYQTAESVVRNAFAPPPSGKALNRNASLWIDPKLKRVYSDGYVAMTRGAIEMFACPIGTKEHESIVATLAESSQVHAALLAVGAVPGTPVRYDPEFLPATGQRIRVWVTWLDKQGKYHAADARSWVQKTGTDETMSTDWVFAGSGFWKDPVDGREYYKADSGDMICVSNFSTAMIDIPVASSAQAGQLLFSPYTERIPERGTPVRLILVPIPIPSDQPNPEDQIDTTTPPGQEVLSKKQKS